MGVNYDDLWGDRFTTDRSFTIAGMRFNYRPSVQAEVIADWLDFPVDGSQRDWLAVTDALMVAALEDDGSREQWDKIRAVDSPFPLTLRDVEQIVSDMLSVMSRRPTESASDSGGTPPKSGTNSKGKSDSREAIPA